MVVLTLCAALALCCATCSPMYVMRAGWEESRILWKRQPIDQLVDSPQTTEELREKFRLVLEARAFAAECGLVPKGSFTAYSDVGRDVLLWVLSGSEKLAFRPVTWWFPIVGRIPYKGFFDKADALAEAKKLQDRNLDVYLRPSPAFSTLGWFDDPLLSTTVRFDNIALVNTVIHEILHNTVWIPDNAPFNETLANVVGSEGAIEFFRRKYGDDHSTVQEAKRRFAAELEFSAFLDDLVKQLDALYKRAAAPESSAEVLLTERAALLEDAVNRWEARHPSVTDREKRRAQLNNATIVAHRIYLDRPEVIVALYAQSGNSLASFVTKLRELEPALRAAAKSGPTHDPFPAIKAALAPQAGLQAEEPPR